MYNSQYYTCEQIDQRLLQGYLDDYNSQNNTNLTKAEFLALLFNTIGRNSTVDNLVTQIGYYECDTNGSTAAKAINVANYALFAGGSIKVKFINKNTANNATLNINSQGAKALYYQGERASATNSWDDNEVVEIYYDSTSYYANNVKGGSGSGVYDVSKEHPTSGPNSDGKFTLEYILNSNNVNELIPVNKRYPGMSIQFVSTSDNKYIQFRCIPNVFSFNPDDWAVCGNSTLEDNPEYLKVYTDKEGKILWAIKVDGNIYYGVGVPQQIINYIEEQINSIKIGTSSTNIDGVDKIVAFLNNFSTNDTLKALIDNKVDKENDKSLIDSNFASLQSTMESPEYVEAKTDSEYHIIEGISSKWRKVINIPIDTLSLSVDSTDNPEWMHVSTDKEGKILGGRRKDGTLVENMPIDNPAINRLIVDVDKLKENPQTVFSIEEFNQVKEDKCTNGMRYLLYSDNSEPFMRVIKNGKISQDMSGRENLAKIAIFGDVHFGYTNTGGYVLDPTSEYRCGVAFTNSNSKNADFSIILGDVIHGGTIEQITEAYGLYYQKMKMLNNPCFQIEGNHDELEKVKIVTGDVFTKTGIIEFGNVRIICFNAIYVAATTDIGHHNGDVSDEVYAWLVDAVRDSYEKGYVTILANHYSLYYDSEDQKWNQSLRNHRDDIIELCSQYNVKLYLHGHVHTAGLLHEIVRNDDITLDMTDILFGWGFMTYGIMEVTETGFNITEYDGMTDEVLHTLYIPMTNQATGTIYT